MKIYITVAGAEVDLLRNASGLETVLGGGGTTVIVFDNSNGQYDFIVLTSINFALMKVGGPVLPYSAFLDFNDVDKLALVGHGSVGKVQSVSAEMIGDHLASKSLGITSKLTKLVITSCYAGMRNNGKAGTSLVEILAEKLRKRGVGGLEIVGYNGPSIKTGALGMFAKVVDDTKLGEAGKLQDALIKQDPNKLSGLSTSSKSSGIAGKAADASSKSKDFYEKFISELEKRNLLLNGDDVARICLVLD